MIYRIVGKLPTWFGYPVGMLGIGRDIVGIG